MSPGWYIYKGTVCGFDEYSKKGSSMTSKNNMALVFLFCMAATAFASEPIHVTYLWHMHQPIYYPYESPQTIDSNGRFNFSVQGVWDSDRVGAYTTWPKDACQAAADKGIEHGGAQMSYSGSLAENNNNLWGFCTGASWDDAIDWARNSLRTSRNNPRLDPVGIAYHHSLMPLTCKETMKMQIRLHKEQYKQLWDTSEYSKGFWPPECAFAEWMIPALVEEGLQWVIVDNGHFFRTIPDFPWSSASSCRVNPAEIQNPSSTELGSTWVQLQNVWAPTKVLAPWAYQPHYIQWVNPSTKTIQKIIAVPAGRYEGNENGRGGYGSFKPENVWTEHIGVNNNPTNPMLLLCHSDGDNYGMKNSDAWHGQHEMFLEMCKANANFEHTSVQDYLDMYPPGPNDIIHVEPGSWIGIDGGTPYFEKWLSSTYVDGENPDHYSWSVLVSAQNRVILADSLENSYLGDSPNMDDVEWGINNDTARAWHAYLNGETSCYWYWDLDRANPWDGNVTRACNTAMYYAEQVIGRHSGVDTKGPSIFPPQRDSYNPGGYMWNETTPASSDFDVWSFVDDASGVSNVLLYYRTDYDGVNPIDSIQNETYDGGSEVSAWTTLDMTSSWDAVKGPDNIVPNPTHRAMKYTGRITGQTQVLLDYFIEAVDLKGNTNRSDMMHVYVGQYSATNAVPVTFSPSIPQDCEDLAVTYNSASRSLSSVSSVTLMINYDNETATNEYAMSGTAGGLWRYTSNIPSGARSAKVMFRNGSTYDNNSGYGWTKSIIACYVAPSVNYTPAAPNGCDPVTITYSPGAGALGSATQVLIHVGYNGWQGVPSPDPAMTKSGTNWTYVYTPPAGAYEIDCVFNDGAGTWENNDGSDYIVAVSNCTDAGAVVVFSPGTPTDCDGAMLATTYNSTGRVLNAASPVWLTVTFDDWTSSNEYAMSGTAGATWKFTNTVQSGATSARVKFRSTDGNLVDDNNGLFWSVAISSCQTSGPSAVSFDPPTPSGCDDVLITYFPNEGPLKDVSQVRIHVGRNGWQDVVDEAMAQVGESWIYTNTLLAGTYQINCCFHDGAGTWDNNTANDWAVSVIGCTGAVPQGIRFTLGSSTVTDDPATNQNNVGDAFDLDESGGYAETTVQGGFGSFGQVYINYDSSNLYIGAKGCDVAGSNNAMVIFLAINTLDDNADNLWSLSGLPQGLDYLHNVGLNPGMDIALLIGDEWGDGTYTNFQLGNGYDMGQGVYYLSTGEGSFVPVPGSKLSQFDGLNRAATTGPDDDGDRLMNRWECSISWNSLGAGTNGISVVTNCMICGLIVSDGTNELNRYISGNYLGASASGTLDIGVGYTNYGFNFVSIDGIEVGMPLSDSDYDGIADSWERQYFSSLAVMSMDSDWDGDGFKDRHEYFAGTNPKDGDSLFVAKSIRENSGGGYVIHWSSITNRTYDLFKTTNLMSDTFIEVTNGLAATPPENVYTDAVENTPMTFYRVRTHN